MAAAPNSSSYSLGSAAGCSLHLPIETTRELGRYELARHFTNRQRFHLVAAERALGLESEANESSWALFSRPLAKIICSLVGSLLASALACQLVD